MQVVQQRLLDVQVEGHDHLKQAIADGHGILITPNHAGHADPFTMYAVADEVATQFYFMAAWQVFQKASFLKRRVLQHHGVFSVDREGTDLRAFRQSTKILQSHRNPLVIFPEGEVYHINERVTPFREGPAAIAITAAKKADRKVVCVPCAIRYHYVEDPTDALLAVMARLEQEIYWRPRGDLPLHQRIARFAEGALALKELEYLGSTRSGTLRDRIQSLTDAILTQIEKRHGLSSDGSTIPERIKSCRQQAIKQLEKIEDDEAKTREFHDNLDDLFVVVQLFSYPGDYVAEHPKIERIAETIDKFEEDFLDVATATIRGARRAVVRIGEPIPVDPSAGRKAGAPVLTALLEERVQALINESADTIHGKE